MNMKIENIATIEELTEIVAGLVMKGLTFEAKPSSNGTWVVYLTGGY